VDATKFLPADDSTRGFDNIAGALGISSTLVEAYVSAAGKISRLAIGEAATPNLVVYRTPEDTSQDYHIEGMPFGTRGGMMANHLFPADGTYSIKVTPISHGNMGNTNPFGDIKGEKLEFLLDGERLKLFDWDTEIGTAAPGGAVAQGLWLPFDGTCFDSPIPARCSRLLSSRCDSFKKDDAWSRSSSACPTTCLPIRAHPPTAQGTISQRPKASDVPKRKENL
jgi:hypothetical protein